MLLDRRRVKFWQKIVFGFMAFLMAAFLVVGYSGVLNGCTWFNSAQQDADAGARPADRQVPGRPSQTDPPTSRPGPASPRATCPARQPAGAGLRGAQKADLDSAAAAPTPRPTSCSPSRRAPPSRQQRLDGAPGAGRPCTASLGTTRRPRASTVTSPALTPKDAQSFFDLGDRRHQRRATPTPRCSPSRGSSSSIPRRRTPPAVKDWIKQNSPKTTPTPSPSPTK